jgi:seryl-tRNA synthetase
VLDIDLIRKEPDRVRQALAKREAEADIDEILAVDQKRRKLQSEADEKRATRNQIAKRIGEAKRTGGDTASIQAEATLLRDQIAAMEIELNGLDTELHDRMAALPNLPDDRVPAGGKENNRVVRTWGEKPSLAEPKDHVALATSLGLIDYERGTKLGGNGFWLYTGKGAQLEWALLDFFCREHVKDGYTMLLPPHLLIEECGYAAGQFPKFVDDVFHVSERSSDRKHFLLPTSETAILNVYRDEILAGELLPIKSFAYSPCYRREGGSHRTEERGTIRGHQFNKVEMFQFTTPEQGEQALEELIGKAERLMQQLGLHHRTSLLAAADTSASMSITYDVEVWMPSLGIYKEVSSISLAKDYQARRAKIRFRREPKAKPELVHTLNASGLATSRLFPALLEQHQQPDGSVRVPEPLRAWLGTDTLRG